MNLARGFVGALGVWNVVVNRLLPERHYVTGNLAASAGLYAMARLAGASPADLGMDHAAVRRGAPAGLLGAAIAAAGSVAASRHPATSGLFNDARAASGDIAYQALVRIPLGTVVFEELVFRGALPAIVDGSARESVSMSSAALFGLWHVLPTLKTMDINLVTDTPTRVKVVVAGVAATAAVAIVFDRLRLRTGSVVAPMLVHWSANAVSYAIAASRQAEAPE